FFFFQAEDGIRDRNVTGVQTCALPILYVFDRGYLDYERFDRMTDEGYFFVSRLRKNAVVRVIDTFSLPANSTVLSDEMVVIGTTQNRTENVFRKIRILDS